MPELRTERMLNVSAERLPKVMENYIRSGANDVHVLKNFDGTWNITARFGSAI